MTSIALVQRLFVLLSLALVALAALALFPAAAGTAVQVGDLSIENPWARATAPSARNGAAFFTVTNDGASDRLIAASADVAEVVELHTHIMDGPVMRMRQVEAIDVTGGTTTALQPGGLHVMLIGLHKPLVEGEQFPLTLTFETAGSVTVEVSVRSLGATGMHPERGGHDGHGGQM